MMRRKTHLRLTAEALYDVWNVFLAQREEQQAQAEWLIAEQEEYRRYHEEQMLAARKERQITEGLYAELQQLHKDLLDYLETKGVTARWEDDGRDG